MFRPSASAPRKARAVLYSHTQILARAATSSGGAYPFTFLSGSSLCISAAQLGMKEAGICQQDAPTVKPAACVCWPTVHGVARGARRAARGVGVGATGCVLRAAERACVRA